MNDEPEYIKLNVGDGWFYHLLGQIDRNTNERIRELSLNDIPDERRTNLENLVERNRFIKEWVLRNTDINGMVVLSGREYQALFWILLENTDLDNEDDDDDYDDEEDDEDE